MRTCIISGGMIEPDFAFPYLQKQQFDIIHKRRTFSRQNISFSIMFFNKIMSDASAVSPKTALG